jgi:hypothetical protein
MAEVWQSSGIHLLEHRDDGWLKVTPDFLRAFLSRPELQPVEHSCDAEIALFDQLLENPFRVVTGADLVRLADADARDNYRIFLALRDLLEAEATLEGAWLALARHGNRRCIAPLFIDQLVHAILAGALKDEGDPMRWRAAELFFRDQSVSTEGGRLMLADDETVSMHASSMGLGGLGQLVAETATPMRRVELDVLDDDNKALYWERSDRFDTVIDFRFTEPANDAFARVVETWLQHLISLEVRVEPRQRIEDPHWSWHIGLDAEASRLLDKLYQGGELTQAEAGAIIGLFRMQVLDSERVSPDMRGKSVYLALAKTAAGKVKMKPQNLIVNLPVGVPQ